MNLIKFGHRKKFIFCQKDLNFRKMELEDDTPQVEDRSMLEALEVLGINPGIESQETTPSSEDVSMPSAIPGIR